MKKLLMIALFSFTVMYAQGETGIQTNDIKVGEVLQIGKPTSWKYNHINFTKANFLIKQGGIANYKVAEGHKVVVTAIKQKKSGAVAVTLERQDGGKFFGNRTSVTANLEKALASSELQTLE
ncbi:MAG: hypothetical protein V7724_00980 [Sediminicola sp.]|tara:strand:- start:49220 stop:49585 length:366 start_codon:yes stop_codon:yes gene_type:complete